MKKRLKDTDIEALRDYFSKIEHSFVKSLALIAMDELEEYHKQPQIAKTPQNKFAPHWNRQNIVNHIEQNFRQTYPDMIVELCEESLGDFDLLPVKISLDNDSFFIVPFVNPNKEVLEFEDYSELDDMDIFAIELSDLKDDPFGDSSKGYNGQSIQLGQLYGGIKILLENFGYRTIRNYKEIFDHS